MTPCVDLSDYCNLLAIMHDRHTQIELRVEAARRCSEFENLTHHQACDAYPHVSYLFPIYMAYLFAWNDKIAENARSFLQSVHR